MPELPQKTDDRRRHSRRNDKGSHPFHSHEYGESWDLAMALLDGPKTREEIAEHHHGYLRLIGFFAAPVLLGKKEEHAGLNEHIDETLAGMLDRGWVTQVDERYALTELGRQEGEVPLAELQRTGRMISTALAPETTSKVSLAVHLVLAAIKLPAGILSGSVGLINDATDTLLDGISSLLVWFGIKNAKERLANVFLVVMMLVTGAFTLWEAVGRILHPEPLGADWFAFVAAIVSALVCAALGFYQRLVGTRTANMALITQATDSNNHVIVAASVTAGLIAALLDFPLLDTLVGLAVALLILKSAIELAIEVFRSWDEDEPDLSHHRVGLLKTYGDFRDRQLRDWMLYLISTESLSRAELLERVRDACDLRGNTAVQALGMADVLDGDASGKTALQSALDEGLVAEAEVLALTDAGRQVVAAAKSKDRRTRLRHHMGTRA